MSTTTDIDSVTNSIMMAMDKELRKNGLAPAGHRHHNGNRALIRGMVAIIVNDAKENGDVPRS